MKRWIAAAAVPAMLAGAGMTAAAAQHSAPRTLVVVADVPGATDPRVTQANIATTICVPGYTKSVRPPVSYTDALKRKLMRSHGYTGPASAWELDHLVALGSGGNPTSPSNLWLQPWPQAHADDRVEVQTQKDICAGRITLAQGQQRLIHLKRERG